MGIFDKVKETANQAKDAAVKFADEKNIGEKLGDATGSLKKALDDTASSIKANNEESKKLKQPLEGALIRYEFTYVGGLDDIPKAKSGAWGMNVMPDRFAFRVTSTTKNWLYDLDVAYEDVTDIRIEKRTISNAEVLLGAGNDANQEQENVIVIEYKDEQRRNATLRVEMLTGVTIFNQAAKCKELMDLLRKNDILDKLKKSEKPASSGDDILAQVEKLSKLKDAGVLSEDEFSVKKSELLAKL